MKWIAKAVVVLLLAASPASAWEWGFKAGGGALFDPTQLGGHVSFEMPLSDEYPTLISVFGEYFRRSESQQFLDEVGQPITGDISASQTLVGAALMYRASFMEAGGTVFFSAGGGLMRAKSKIEFSDGVTDGPVSNNEAMLTVGAGLMFNVTERMALYGQVRLFRNFAATGVVDNNVVGMTVGLHLPLGG